MRRVIITSFAFLFVAMTLCAEQKITIASITSGEFSAETISGVNPIKGTDQYAQISKDRKKIVQYSFKTGKETQVLFDVDHTMGEQIKSFDGYIMSPDGTKMLIQTQTERIYRRSSKSHYYIYTIASRKLQRLSDGGKQQAPVWSPDGNQVAFVRDNNIFLVKLLYDNAESQVTKDGKQNAIINGIPDWVYEEEFSFDRALTFNADGTSICWIKFDESQVHTYPLLMFKGLSPEMAANSEYPDIYSYKYPKAGQANSKVSVWSYDIKSHKTLQLQVPCPDDGYIPRIYATDDPQRIIVFTLNRHQDTFGIFAVSPQSTIAQQLIQEQVSEYIKEETVTGTIITGNNILVPSDKDGYMKIRLYTMTGQLQRTVGGDFDITAVYGYDVPTGDIYYQAAAQNPHDRQIYVAHKNGKSARLSNQDGWNTAIFSDDFKYFINTWSDYDTPYVYTVRDNQGRTLFTPIDNAALKQKTQAYGWTKKEPFTFTTSEGVSLDGWMIKPADFSPSKKYPVVMFQYGGPGSQQVVNSWSAGSMGQGGAFDYYLAQQGFIVVCVDGRGTAARGSAFEKCIYQGMGNLEAKDQVEAALWLGKQSYVDAGRIGIWGWSYGGFNTLMSMSEGRPVFKAGVAVAPPTNWKYYDSVYTERYMRTPQENPDGYADNPCSRASRLSGALLICHGMADDNVHPQNTFEYSEALVQADKDFKELFYTNRNHSIYGGNTRNHLLRQIANFFIENLK